MVKISNEIQSEKVGMALSKIKDQYVRNPVIVNIGISKYDHLDDLSSCQKDMDNFDDLWINVYGFDEDAIFDNEDEPRLTKDGFFDIIRQAKAKLDPPKKRKRRIRKTRSFSLMENDEKSTNKEEETKLHDGIIICFSGHGSIHSILTSEYDKKDEGEITIKEIQDEFTGNSISSRVKDCPRILILDACRGEEEAISIKKKT